VARTSRIEKKWLRTGGRRVEEWKGYISAPESGALGRGGKTMKKLGEKENGQKKTKQKRPDMLGRA